MSLTWECLSKWRCFMNSCISIILFTSTNHWRLKYDKSQTQYDQAYSLLTNTLLPHYQSRINPASKAIPEVFFAANFELIHKLEEIRYVSNKKIERRIYLFLACWYNKVKTLFGICTKEWHSRWSRYTLCSHGLFQR